MKKKSYIGLVNAGGTGFSIETGAEIDLDKETAEDLMRAAYVWPAKKDQTIAEARRAARAHRAKILAAQEEEATGEPDAEPTGETGAELTGETGAEPTEGTGAEPVTDPAEDQ